MPLQGMIIMNTGQNIEEIRATIEQLLPYQQVPTTASEERQSSNRAILAFERVMQVGALIMLVITGCTLVVGMTGGILESRQAFMLLRPAGVPLRVLNVAVLYEAAIPLFVAGVIALPSGILFGNLLLELARYSLNDVSLGYCLFVCVGLLTSLALSLLALPLLARVTEPTATRFE